LRLTQKTKTKNNQSIFKISISSRFEPYCSVCAYFASRDSTGKLRASTVGVDEPSHYALYERLHSRRCVNDIMFVRDPAKIAQVRFIDFD